MPFPFLEMNALWMLLKVTAAFQRSFGLLICIAESATRHAQAQEQEMINSSEGGKNWWRLRTWS